MFVHSLDCFKSFRVTRPLHSPLCKSSSSSIGTQELDWPNLGFEYRQTNSFFSCKHSGGKWGPIEKHSDPYISIHIGATALHYGQACFEGLKAFHSKDGKVSSLISYY